MYILWVYNLALSSIVSPPSRAIFAFRSVTADSAALRAYIRKEHMGDSLDFTRHCHHQYCMLNGINRAGRWGAYFVQWSCDSIALG